MVTGEEPMIGGSKSVGQAVKWGIAVIAVLFLFYLVDFRSLLAALSNVTLPLLAALLLISLVLVIVSVIKWRLFLQRGAEAHDRVSFGHLFGLYLVGYFINLVVPSFVGGDAVRSFYLGKQTGQHQAAAATILERFTGLLAMTILGSVFMWWSSMVPLWTRCIVLSVLAALVLGAYVALNPRWVEWVARQRAARLVARHLQRMQEALRLATRSPKLLINAFLLSFLFHLLTVVNVVVCAYAVGWLSPPWWDLYVVLPVILLIGALPLTPQGLGVQEFGFVLFLHQVGATEAQGLGIALILRAKQYLLALLGGVYWLRLQRGTYSSHRHSAEGTPL